MRPAESSVADKLWLPFAPDVGSDDEAPCPQESRAHANAPASAGFRSLAGLRAACPFIGSPCLGGFEPAQLALEVVIFEHVFELFVDEILSQAKLLESVTVFALVVAFPNASGVQLAGGLRIRG